MSALLHDARIIGRWARRAGILPEATFYRPSTKRTIAQGWLLHREPLPPEIVPVEDDIPTAISETHGQIPKARTLVLGSGSHFHQPGDLHLVVHEAGRPGARETASGMYRNCIVAPASSRHYGTTPNPLRIGEDSGNALRRMVDPEVLESGLAQLAVAYNLGQ
jgi:hypothetical protein